MNARPLRKMNQYFYLLLLCSSSVVAQISIVGELTHEKQAKPGDKYSRTITVYNDDTDPRDVRIYQTDYFFQADGKNYYGEPGKLARSNASWISFTPKQTTVQPKERTNINYEVSVPEDSSMVGTYWSMIMVEEVPEIPIEKPEQNINLNVVMRYAIQMITNIGDTGIRKIKFVEPQLIKEEGKVVLLVDIENIGERWLKPDVWVELYTLEGKSAGTFKGSKTRIYPGTSTRINVDVSKAISGTYKALLVADCGDEDLFGANYTIKINR